MAFDLVQRNTVVRGEFNAAIIRPRWLVNQGLFQHGEAGFQLSDRPGGPRVFNFHEYQWEIGQDRLVLTCRDVHAGDPGECVARILKILPHTPVTAVGHNFVFESSEIIDAICPHIGRFAGNDLAELLGHDLAKSDGAVVLSIDDERSLTIRVFAESPTQKIDLNFHYAASDTRAAQEAARTSQRCLERAREIVKRLTEH